jgi:hypothetical protein
VSSFAFVLSSTMVPKEMNYFVPGAQGNTATCTAQGFLVAIGFIAAALCNCSICVYCLAIVKYNKKDGYIRNKLEPWFHGISIIIPLVFGIILMTMMGYNVYESGACFVVPNDPPHCIGYENGDTPKGFSIPCGRGDGGENTILYRVNSIVGFGSVLIITPTAIVGTMLILYRSVSKIEQRMQNYGVSALRLNARSGGGNRGENAETNSTRSASDQHGVMRRVKRLFMNVIPPCLRRDDHPRPTSRSNRATSQKRAILHMAAGYALSWTFVFIPFMIVKFLHESHAILILHSCLNPLQGLFNLLVSMPPKVRNAKRSRRGEEENLTWRQAFIKAYMSRGERRRRTVRNTTSRNTRGGGISWWQQRLQRFLKTEQLHYVIRSMRQVHYYTEQQTIRVIQIQSRTVSAAAENLPSSNHLPADDSKDVEENTSNPKELANTDEDEKCEEEKDSYHHVASKQIVYSLPPTVEKIEQP